MNAMQDFHTSLTDRAILRILREADSAEAFAATARDRAHLEPWLPFVHRIRELDHMRRFIRFRLDQHEKGNGFLAGIFLDGVFVGGAGFHGYDRPPDKTDIGYWLAPHAQGQGLATLAVAALVDHAFDAEKLNRVEIRIDVANSRSRKVPQRLGFQLEGILRQDGFIADRRVDHALYAVLAADWKSRARRPL